MCLGHLLDLYQQTIVRNVLGVTIFCVPGYWKQRALRDLCKRLGSEPKKRRSEISMLPFQMFWRKRGKLFRWNL